MTDYSLLQSLTFNGMFFGVQVDVAASTDRPVPPTNKPYRCVRCGYRSNWKSDVTKHVRALHPLSRVVAMDDDDATATLVDYEARVTRETAEASHVDGGEAVKSTVQDDALYTVDRQVRVASTVKYFTSSVFGNTFLPRDAP